MEETLTKRLGEFGGVARPDGLRPLISGLKRQLAALDHALAALERRRLVSFSSTPGETS